MNTVMMPENYQPLRTRPTAVYRLFDAAGTLLYVGMTSSPGQRMADHEDTKEWWPQVRRVDIAWFDSRPQAFAAESVAIRDERPLRNLALRWPLRARAAPLDKTSDEPVYMQIAGIIMRRIESGEYQSDRAIPSIVHTAARLGVGEMMVRKVIALLVDEGLLETVSGRGTFVVKRD